MTGTDFLSVLQWWTVLFFIGVACFPFASRLFSSFFDKGYIFSKSLGLALLSYLILLTGVIHFLPFTQTTSMVLLLILAAGCYGWKQGYLSAWKNFTFSWKAILSEELLFFLALLAWSYVRAFAPDIHGLEKYMDFGFVNSLLRSEYFPAKDMWFTPFPINYYYFGHLVTAVLTKLSGIPSFITFNLMIATIFALALTSSFSLGANLYGLISEKELVRPIKRTLAGVISALLVCLGGNLHILYAFFTPYGNDAPMPLWKLTFAPLSFPNSYWYPNATRFIYNTIHEFPIYSWVVADLHGHVTDVPFVLLTLALLLSFLSTFSTTITETKLSSVRHHLVAFKSEVGYLIVLGFILAVMYMTNAWDGLMYVLLTALVCVYLYGKRVVLEKEHHHAATLVTGIFPALRTKLAHRPFLDILSQVTVAMGIIGSCFVLFALPFTLFFQAGAIVHGIGVLCAPDFLTHIGKLGPLLFEPSHCQKSPWWQLLTLYGFFLFFIIAFIIFLIRKAAFHASADHSLNLQKIRFHMKLVHTWQQMKLSDVFVLLLILLSVFLIIIPEFFYLKDIYPAHYRANTMFKLVFQAFILLSLSSGYILVRIISALRERTTEAKSWYVFFVFPAIFICGLVLIYPYLATSSFYGNLTTYQGLNGVTYLQKQYPTDFAGIQWLNAHVTGQPVILEAQGDSYTDFGRVSTNTGLPTVLGWTVHEWLWRGTYDIPAPRITEVADLYTSPDAQLTRSLVKKYAIKYVFLGDLERQKYPTLVENKWDAFGKIVFQQGQTKIYHLRP